MDYDNWVAKIDFSKKHKPLKKEDTKFNNLSSLDRISAIVEKFQESKIAISYGDPGTPTIDEIKSLLKGYKKNIEVFDIEYSYKLNRKNGSALREVLIIAS